MGPPPPQPTSKTLQFFFSIPSFLHFPIYSPQRYKYKFGGIFVGTPIARISTHCQHLVSHEQCDHTFGLLLEENLSPKTAKTPNLDTLVTNFWINFDQLEENITEIMMSMYFYKLLCYNISENSVVAIEPTYPFAFLLTATM